MRLKRPSRGRKPSALRDQGKGEAESFREVWVKGEIRLESRAGDEVGDVGRKTDDLRRRIFFFLKDRAVCGGRRGGNWRD